MNKPTRSKLSLATETVRALSGADLIRVHGGLLPNRSELCPASGKPNDCGPTTDLCAVKN